MLNPAAVHASGQHPSEDSVALCFTVPGGLSASTTAPHTRTCCCTRRVPEGTVDVVLSYCHNSLHDTSLLKVCGGGYI